MLTLTYYGAEKWMPHYNVMGVAKAALEASVRYLAADLGEQNIRVNAISAGPIKTLAASRHRRLPLYPEVERYNAPMRRTVTIEGRERRPSLSPMSRGVTRRNPVQATPANHVVGMKKPDRPTSLGNSPRHVEPPAGNSRCASPRRLPSWFAPHPSAPPRDSRRPVATGRTGRPPRVASIRPPVAQDRDHARLHARPQWALVGKPAYFHSKLVGDESGRSAPRRLRAAHAAGLYAGGDDRGIRREGRQQARAWRLRSAAARHVALATFRAAASRNCRSARRAPTSAAPVRRAPAAGRFHWTEADKPAEAGGDRQQQSRGRADEAVMAADNPWRWPRWPRAR